MKTLAAIRRERLAVLRKLKPVARKADGHLEQFERELVRLIKRKRAVPEQEDMRRLMSFLQELLEQCSKLERQLEQGYIE